MSIEAALIAKRNFASLVHEQHREPESPPTSDTEEDLESFETGPENEDEDAELAALDSKSSVEKRIESLSGGLAKMLLKNAEAPESLRSLASLKEQESALSIGSASASASAAGLVSRSAVESRSSPQKEDRMRYVKKELHTPSLSSALDPSLFAGLAMAPPRPTSASFAKRDVRPLSENPASLPHVKFSPSASPLSPMVFAQKDQREKEKDKDSPFVIASHKESDGAGFFDAPAAPFAVAQQTRQSPTAGRGALATSPFFPTASDSSVLSAIHERPQNLSPSLAPVDRTLSASLTSLSDSDRRKKNQEKSKAAPKSILKGKPPTAVSASMGDAVQAKSLSASLHSPRVPSMSPGAKRVVFAQKNQVFHFSSLNRDEAEDPETGKKEKPDSATPQHRLKTRKVKLLKRETALTFAAAQSGTRKRFTIERDATEERPDKFLKDH